MAVSSAASTPSISQYSTFLARKARVALPLEAVLCPVPTAVVLFSHGYRLYGRLVAHSMGLVPGCETSSLSIRDEMDFVQPHLEITLSHHFASNTRGGPILGAPIYGYSLPLIWFLVGCVVSWGAVHDFTARAS